MQEQNNSIVKEILPNCNVLPFFSSDDTRHFSPILNNYSDLSRLEGLRVYYHKRDSSSKRNGWKGVITKVDSDNRIHITYDNGNSTSYQRTALCGIKSDKYDCYFYLFLDILNTEKGRSENRDNSKAGDKLNFTKSSAILVNLLTGQVQSPHPDEGSAIDHANELISDSLVVQRFAIFTAKTLISTKTADAVIEPVEATNQEQEQ